MGLHDKRIATYGKVDNYLQTTYATDVIIAQASKKLETYKQESKVSAALYAMRLYNKELQCKIVYEKKRVKLLIVERLNESICDNLGLF